MEAVIDLGEKKEFSSISSGFLQVANHIVFFPESVSYFASDDGVHFKLLQKIATKKPITKESKRNDIEYFDVV